jgi:hypothetical protein
MLKAAHYLYLIEIQVAITVAVWTIANRGKLIIPLRLADFELQVGSWRPSRDRLGPFPAGFAYT